MILINIALWSPDTFSLLHAVFLCVHDAFEGAEFITEFLRQGFDTFPRDGL